MSQTENEIKKELLEIKFPRLDVSPMKRHPLADEFYKSCEQNFAELGLSFAYEREFIEFVCLSCPYATDPQLLYFLYIAVISVTIIHDFLEDKDSKEEEIWRKYLLEKTCPGENLAEKLFLLMIKLGRKIGFTEEQLDFINYQIVKEFDCRPNIKKIVQGTKISDEEYMKIRIIDFNMYFFLCIYAFGFGITVEQINNNKVVQELMSEILKDAVITNELYSLRKAVYQGKFKWSYIYVKMRNHNISAQKATEFLLDEVKLTKDRVMALAKQLKSTNDINMGKFADAVESIIDGHRYWSGTCKRYNGIHLFQQ